MDNLSLVDLSYIAHPTGLKEFSVLLSSLPTCGGKQSFQVPKCLRLFFCSLKVKNIHFICEPGRPNKPCGLQMTTNVCFIKIHTKHSSNALLSLVQIFMKQTLFSLKKRFGSIRFCEKTQLAVFTPSVHFKTP